jgi:hypothetical protein
MAVSENVEKSSQIAIWLVVWNIFSISDMGCHPKKVLARSIPPVRDVWGFSLSEPFPEWVAIALPTGSIFFSEPLVGHPFTALHWADWFANTNST